MRDEEELIEEARRSVEETEELREESGLALSDEPGPEDPLPKNDSVGDDES